MTRELEQINRATRRMEGATLALAVVVVGFVYVQLAQPFAFRPLRNVSPQTIGSPVVARGQALHVTATKCNDSSADVAIKGSSWWIRLDPPPRQVVLHQDGGGIRSPGCRTFEFDNVVPPTLPLGTWRLEGIEIARSGSQEQQEGWFTEPFEVVAP